MKKGDRISYQGQPGVIVEDIQVTPGMLDVKLDHESFVRRAAPAQLARVNGRARRNSEEEGDTRVFPMGISPSILPLVRTQKSKPVTRKPREKELSQEERIEKVYKEAEGYAKVVSFRLGSLASLANRHLSSTLPTNAEYDKLEKAVTDLRNRLRGQAEKAAVAERAAKLFKPASGRIRGLLQHGETGKRTAMDRPGAGVFTRPDPPRQATDGRICGNFIDGTAYYMAVSDLSRPDTRFISWTELYESAAENGYGPADLQSCVDVVADFTLGSLSKKLRSAILFGESTRSGKRDESQEYGLFNRYLLSIKDQSFRAGEKNQPYNDYLQVLTDMVNRGWRIGDVALAGLYVRRGGEGPWVLVPAPQIEGRADTFVKRGDDVKIVVPKVELLWHLTKYFNKVYAPARRKKGYEFFTRKESLSPRGSGQAVTAKKGKKSRKTAIDVKVVGRGPTRELVVTRARRGPTAEELTGTAKKRIGYQAYPGKTFAQLGEKGRMTYWVQKRSVLPGQETHRSFLPFGGATRGQRLKWASTSKKELTAIEALVLMSARQPPAVSAEVAAMLFASELVRLEYRDEESGYIKRVIANPDDGVEEGDVLSVWDEKKAKDPYFSWTRELVTDKLNSGDVGPCLSVAEEDALKALTSFRNNIFSLKGKMESIQRIFRQVAEDHTGASVNRNHSIGRLLKRLGYTLSELARIKGQVERDLRAPAGSLEYKAGRLTLDALASDPETGIESPFALFSLDEGKLVEADSLLNRLLRRAEELDIFFGEEDEQSGPVYVINQLADASGQQRLLNRLQKSFLSDEAGLPELGATGVRFLRGEESEPLSTDMGLAFMEAGAELGQDYSSGSTTIHPLDDFFSWSLRVTNGLSDHTMTLRREGKPLPARRILTYKRAASALGGLTGSVTYGELRRGKSEEQQRKRMALDWSDSIRGFAIGGQRPARRRSGPPAIASGEVEITPSAREWLQARSQVALPFRASMAPRLPKGPGRRVSRTMSVVTDASSFRLHAQTGVPVAIDVEAFQEDAEERGSWLELSERLDRNDAYTLLLSDVFNSRIGVASEADREAEVLQLRRMSKTYTGRDDRILELMLLAYLYYDLNGYELAGALGAESFQGEEAEINSGIAYLNAAIQDISGGSPLGGTRQEKFTVWKTYNPVLFEMARLYWPTVDYSEPKFKSILAQAKVFSDVDSVGRYGKAASVLGHMTLKSKGDPEGLLFRAVGEPFVWLYNLLVLNNDYADRFVDAARSESWTERDRGDAAQILRHMQSTTSYTVVQLKNSLDVMDWFWPVGLDLHPAASLVNDWLQDPFAVLRSWKAQAAQSFPKLLAHRESGLPPTLAESILSDEAIREALSSETPVDPNASDDNAVHLLRLALAKAVYMKHGKRVRIGPTNEQKWLADFIKAPPRVRVREGRTLKAVRLEPMTRFWPAIGPKQKAFAYAPEVIRNLGRVELSIEAPPGEQEYEGENNVPWLLRERTSPFRAKGKTTFTGQRDIWDESVLAQVEIADQQEEQAYRSLMAGLDDLIAAVEKELKSNSLDLT